MTMVASMGLFVSQLVRDHGGIVGDVDDSRLARKRRMRAA
jgi:hypothetical protein